MNVVRRVGSRRRTPASPRVAAVEREFRSITDEAPALVAASAGATPTIDSTARAAGTMSRIVVEAGQLRDQQLVAATAAHHDRLAGQPPRGSRARLARTAERHRAMTRKERETRDRARSVRFKAPTEAARPASAPPPAPSQQPRIGFKPIQSTEKNP